ncbi:ribonucleotide-diphosphate reductase subunit beta, partial [Staphylococcus aureus]
DAQHLRNELSESEKQQADQEMYKLLNDLYLNEESYTKMLYDDLGITEDVLKYVKYNGNKAISNLCFETYFEESDFKPII